jgi:hypothetical protein
LASPALGPFLLVRRTDNLLDKEILADQGGADAEVTRPESVAPPKIKPPPY